MNPVAARLKAIAVTALFFAASAFCLLGVIWILDVIPFGFPGSNLLARYSPHASIAAVSDLRAVVTLSAAYLVAAALVLLINAEYFDRMLAIFSDVLLMMMAAIAGFIAGYWVLLRLGGYENFLQIGFVQAALVSPIVVFLVSIVPMHRLRANMPVSVLAALILLLGGPALLLMMS